MDESQKLMQRELIFYVNGKKVCRSVMVSVLVINLVDLTLCVRTTAIQCVVAIGALHPLCLTSLSTYTISVAHIFVRQKTTLCVATFEKFLWHCIPISLILIFIIFIWCRNLIHGCCYSLRSFCYGIFVNCVHTTAEIGFLPLKINSVTL